jgi:peroxiredoxin
MSRRNTYLLGGLAVLAGIVMLVVAISSLTSDGDDSTPATRTDATERQITPGSQSPPSPDTSADTGGSEPSGAKAQGEEIRSSLARRRPVQAPSFNSPLIHAGTIPQSLRKPVERAAARDALDLSKLRGTPVVLHLWSSKCAPCRGDARLFEATWKRWGPRGVLFVGVSVNESADTARAVIRQYDLTYPGTSDRSGKIAKRYGASALPQTYFISAGGDIVGEVAGSPSVRQLELGASSAESGRTFGSEQGSSSAPLP